MGEREIMADKLYVKYFSDYSDCTNVPVIPYEELRSSIADWLSEFMDDPYLRDQRDKGLIDDLTRVLHSSCPVLSHVARMTRLVAFFMSAIMIDDWIEWHGKDGLTEYRQIFLNENRVSRMFDYIDSSGGNSNSTDGVITRTNIKPDVVTDGQTVVERLNRKLFLEMAPDLSEYQRKQYVKDFRAFYPLNLEESLQSPEYIFRVERISEAEYKKLRKLSVGAGYFSLFAEYLLNVQLPGWIYKSPPMKRFYKIFDQYMILTNDIYSYEKELRQDGRALMNYVTVVMRERRCPTAQMAIDLIVVEVIQLERQLLDLTQRLRTELLTDYHKYLDAIGYSLRINLYYYAKCKRYKVDSNLKIPDISQNTRNWFDFDKTYNRLMTVIVPDKDGNRDVAEWLRALFEYNVPHGKRNRGMAVVKAYDVLAQQLAKTPTEEDSERARIMGWIMEILQAGALVLDDIIDGSSMRRDQLCWYRQNDLGMRALNDGIALYIEGSKLLTIFFSNQEFYENIITLHIRIGRTMVHGQCMDVMSNPPGRGPQFALFTQQRYARIVKYKTAYYTFVGPVRAVMYMHGIDSEEEHKRAENVLLKIGHLFQIQDDFLDCFGDPKVVGKVGTDIEEGKCCWPVVIALPLCNENQLRELKSNYGIHNEECVQRVKAVYNELNVKDIYYREEELLYSEIRTDIDGFETTSTVLPEIFRDILSKTYKRNK